MTIGKLELIIKINELPTNVQTNKDNWKIFQLDCDGRIVSVTVKPKIWKKLEDAVANYPQWVAAISGKMGESTSDGFVLSEPSIQVFEKKPKESKPEAGQWEDKAQAQQMWVSPPSIWHPFIEMVKQTHLPFMETVRVMISVAK